MPFEIVSSEDFKPNRLILRETLTNQQTLRSRSAFDRFGKFLAFRSFEHWEVSFLTEGDVDRELGIYDLLIRAFELAAPKDTERSATAQCLLALSLSPTNRGVGALSRRVRERVERAFHVAMSEREAMGLGHTYVVRRPATQEEREAMANLN